MEEIVIPMKKHRELTTIICTCGYTGLSKWEDFGVDAEHHDWAEVCPDCEEWAPQDYTDLEEMLSRIEPEQIEELKEIYSDAAKNRWCVVAEKGKELLDALNTILEEGE